LRRSGADDDPEPPSRRRDRSSSRAGFPRNENLHFAYAIGGPTGIDAVARKLSKAVDEFAERSPAQLKALSGAAKSAKLMTTCDPRARCPGSGSGTPAFRSPSGRTRSFTIERAGDRRSPGTRDPGLHCFRHEPTLWERLQTGACENAPAHRHTPRHSRFVMTASGGSTRGDGDAAT